MRPWVLASTSPYRRALLARLGTPFEAAAPATVEDHELPLGTDELALELARRKAESLGPRYPDALIIGADQIAELDGERLFKPGTVAAAVDQLRRLSGRSHRLVTGLAVHEPATGRTEQALDVQHMTLRPLTAEQIRRYVERERPVDCAGSYKIEGLGIALFSATRGDDYSGIVGLPLIRLCALLGRFGVDPLSSGGG